MTVPVSLWSTCFGDYHSYLEGWMDAVAVMSPLPDEIVLVTDDSRAAAVWVPRFSELGVRLQIAQQVPEPRPMTWVVPWYNNRAVLLTDHEWVWRCDIDDRMAPGALQVFANAAHYQGPEDPLRSIDILVGGNQMWTPERVDPAYVVAAEFNALVSSSGFRRSCWQAVGGYPDIAYDDWGLWRRLARHALARGQQIVSVGTTYHYTPHGDSVSSQVNVNQARAEVMAL